MRNRRDLSLCRQRSHCVAAAACWCQPNISDSSQEKRGPRDAVGDTTMICAHVVQAEGVDRLASSKLAIAEAIAPLAMNSVSQSPADASPMREIFDDILFTLLGEWHMPEALALLVLTDRACNSPLEGGGDAKAFTS